MTALNDWNTTFPPAAAITDAANALGQQGFDVHTVIITLDNGGWSVEMQHTDEDMADGIMEFTLGAYGALERV